MLANRLQKTSLQAGTTTGIRSLRQRFGAILRERTRSYGRENGGMCMQLVAGDRRKSARFDVRLALRYRLSQKGIENRWCAGVTRDMSKDGLVFKSRRPLPVGSHVEVRIDWPVPYHAIYPMDLQITGFVVRNEHGRSAVRISSHRFLIHSEAESLVKTA